MSESAPHPRVYRRWADMPEAVRDQIADAYKALKPITEIMRRHQVTRETILRHCDEAWAVTRREGINLSRQLRRHGRGSEAVRSYHVHEDAKRLARLIPEDCRNLTARFCGDPIPNDPRRAP